MNNATIFTEFSDSSRIWIYGFETPLTPDDSNLVKNELNKFMTHWNAHGIPVQGGFTIVHDIFVILCADANQNVSGCSIDSSVQIFKSLKENHSLNALNYDLVYYKDNNYVNAISRNEFQQLINNDEVNQNTIVFNNTIQNLKEFQDDKWEVPLSESWHFKAFLKTSDLAIISKM